MCSQTFCPGGGDILSLRVWLSYPMLLLERGLYPWSHVPSRRGSLSMEGLCLGVSVQKGLCREIPPPGIRKVGGAHPTRMLSCVQFI